MVQLLNLLLGKCDIFMISSVDIGGKLNYNDQNYNYPLLIMWSIRQFLIAASSLSVLVGGCGISYAQETVNLDPGVKGAENRRLEYQKVFKSSSQPDISYFFDKEYKGQGCVFGCDVYVGIMAKWSSYYLQLQPYDKRCTLTCRTFYSMPPLIVTISIGGLKHELSMVDKDEYIYYIPLAIRKSISNSTADVALQIQGSNFPDYKLSDKSLALLRTVMNTSQELPIALPPKVHQSKAERLVELKDLFEKKLISDKEYLDLRIKILAE